MFDEILPKQLITAELDSLPHETSIVKLLEGAANNLPDKPTQRVASLIVDFAASVTKNDILITLISDDRLND
ncbi:hypothetical protein LSAT2_026998 [Lamellibrachia satsuma]|nr:hypothetical protein LSAT2_026998 [Lamellibrachia satsuma]